MYDQNGDDDEESEQNDNIYGQNEDIVDSFSTVNENVEWVIWKRWKVL